MCVVQKSSAQIAAEKAQSEALQRATLAAIAACSPQPKATFLACVDTARDDYVCARAQYQLQFPTPPTSAPDVLRRPLVLMSDGLKWFEDAPGGRPMQNARGERRREDEVGDEAGFVPDNETLALLQRFLGTSETGWAAEAAKHIEMIEALKAEEQRLVLGGNLAAAAPVRKRIEAERRLHREQYLTGQDGALILPFGKNVAVIPDKHENLIGNQISLELREGAFPAVREVQCLVSTQDDEATAGAKSRGGSAKKQTSGGKGDLPWVPLPQVKTTPTEDGGECAVLVLWNGIKALQEHQGLLQEFATRLDEKRASGAYAESLQAAHEQLEACKAFVQAMDEHELDPGKYAHWMLPEEIFMHLDAQLLGMLQDGTHTLLFKRLPKTHNSTCALRYLSVSARTATAEPCVEVPNTEREPHHFTALPPHIDDINLCAVVAAPSNVGVVEDWLSGAWVHGDAGAFANAALAGKCVPDLKRVYVDELNDKAGLVVPFVLEPELSEKTTAERMEEAFPGMPRKDVRVHRQVFLRNDTYSTVAEPIPNRNLCLRFKLRAHADEGADVDVAPAGSVLDWDTGKVLSFVGAVLDTCMFAEGKDQCAWLASMEEQKTDGKALAAATMYSLKRDFGIEWDFGKRICQAVMRERLARVPTSAPSAGLLPFMCRVRADEWPQWHDGKFVCVNLGDTAGAAGGAAVWSSERALALLSRIDTRFVHADTKSALEAAAGLSRALGGVALEHVLRVGMCVEEQEDMPRKVCVAVLQHDGKDDDKGEVLHKDKLLLTRLEDGTPVVHADVSENQIIKVYLKNASGSDIVAENDYINDEGELEKSPKTVQLPRGWAECLDLDGLQYTEGELNGYEVSLQHGTEGRKRKLLFLASVGTKMLKRSKTFVQSLV
jgi:hypothetical protein